MYETLRIKFFDYQSRQSMTMWSVHTDSEAPEDYAPLLEAVGDVTEAMAPIATAERFVAAEPPSPGEDGPYASHRDFMRLVFKGPNGHTTFNVAAPKASCFNPDGTVNVTDLGVSNLIAQILIDGVDNGGAELDAFVSGVRWYFSE